MEMVAGSSGVLEGALRGPVGRVRVLLGGVVEGVCGTAPKAHVIADRFGVYRSLGWQVWNLVYLEDALEVVRHLPPVRSRKVWFEAIEKAGVAAGVIEAIERAMEGVDAVMAEHASDREMFEMMVDSHVKDDDAEVDLKWRRQMFSGSAYVWGVRAKMLLTCAIISPGAKGEMFDLVRIHALQGLVRTRSEVRWPLARVTIQAKQERKEMLEAQPLVAGEVFARTGVPLMEPWCSQPIPAIERRELEDGTLVDDLLPGPVGETGKVDVVTGEVIRGTGTLREEEPGQMIRFGYSVRTPCELTIGDQLVHRSLFQEVKRELKVYSEMGGGFGRDERDAIQVRDRFEYLGRASERLALGEVPRYGELVDAGLRAIGFSRDEFDVYRIRMPYPPTPARVSLRHRKVAEET